MLDKNDIQIITDIVNNSVNSAVNNAVLGLRAEMSDMNQSLRTEMSEMNNSLRTEINKSMREEMSEMSKSLRAEMSDMNQSLRTEIKRSENRVMTYIESHVENEIHKISDGHLMLADKMDRMAEDITEIKCEASEIKGVLTAHEIVYMEDKGITNLEEYRKATILKAGTKS